MQPRSSPIGVSLHLVPEHVWSEQKAESRCIPEGFAEDGFVHCTDGEKPVIEVANRYYRGDSRPYLVLDIDLTHVSAPTIYEDPDRLYPHIYGRIEREAVTLVRRVERGPDGVFLVIGATVA
jgi:uncharacterized protein (DUF952 family)